MVAELGQDGVEHDAAERVVLDAEHAQRGHRISLGFALRLAGLARFRRVQRHGQSEGGAAAAPRCDRDVAAHRARQLLDRGKAQAGAAEARGDGDIGLGEGAEQPLDLGHGQADAAVGHREGDADLALRLVSGLALGGTPRRDRERDTALLGELDGIVDQVLERGAQTDGIADHQPRQLLGDIDLGLEALGRGASGERIAGAAGERAQIEQILPQGTSTLARPLAGPGGIDEQGGKARQMLGTGLDGVGPAPLALAQIGGGEQVADR
ncbi:hypothetical protein BJS_09084 [Bradyrhizobium japonicum SEMIA 5079]|nr:hypothetical protein BJS_09084 [Bradyrhizobium japonicum SEMIA 5079]